MDYASKGKLYIVATPIGHLEDITYRAVNVLNGVDLVLSEDTRETLKIFRKYNIDKPQISYTDQKHSRMIEMLVSKLVSGVNIALTSDSGTPLISDPGFKLVERIKKEGFDVVSIPGPSSPIAALSVSGLPTDKFMFLGFLPKSKLKRQKILQEYENFEGSLIIFESPHKIKDLLLETYDVLGSRAVSVVKDITKKFEKVITANLKDILGEKLKGRGEYILIVAKKGYKLNG